jgi:hypothetical protein
MIISIDAEKAFGKIQHLYMIKALKKVVIAGRYLNMIKAVHDRTMINITLNREKLKSFPINSGRRQGCPLLLNVAHGFLARVIRQEKEISDTNRKEQSQIIPVADDMAL